MVSYLIHLIIFLKRYEYALRLLRLLLPLREEMHPLVLHNNNFSSDAGKIYLACLPTYQTYLPINLTYIHIHTYSFLEIYQEEIRDLLASDPKQKRELKEDPQRGVTVKDLTDVIVQDEASLLKVMEKGVAHRTVGATLMNEVKG